MIKVGDEEVRLIDGCTSYYIDKKGNVYSLKNGEFKRIKSYSYKGGYSKVQILYCNKRKYLMVHRLVAMTWIPNPNKLNIVGHKDNNKTNNCVDNLYWTTQSENTQKAYDDGLCHVAKGIDDELSIPIACYNNDNKLVGVYGSIKQAVRCIKGLVDSSVSKVLNSDHPTKKGYRFKTITKEQYYQFDDKFKNVCFEVKFINKPRFKIKVTNLIDKSTFICESQQDAMRKTGISQCSISYHLKSKTPIQNYFFENIPLTTIENKD